MFGRVHGVRQSVGGGHRPPRPSPSDEDLRQMFAYANIFKATKTILIYPKVFDFQPFVKGIFNQSNGLSCDLLFADVIGENGLNREIGREILEKC